MKKNWQTKKLNDVCDLFNGLWKGKEPPYIRVGVIRNTNFTKEGKLNDTDIAYLDVEKKQLERRKLVYGDIILEKSGGGPKQPVGRVIIFDKQEGDFSFSNFTTAIRVKRANDLDFNFLHRFLFFFYISGKTEAMQSHSTGIRNLDLKAYKDILIPLLSVSEQQHIVKILDEVFKKIEKAKENTEKNLRNSRELFESYSHSIFSNPGNDWKETKLKDLAEVQSGGTPSRAKQEYWNGDIPWYSSGELNELFTLEPKRFITTKGLENSNAKVFPKGSLLIGMYDTAALKMSIIDREATFNQAIAGVKPNKEMDLVFVLYAINAIKPAILSQRRGVRQKNLNLDKIKNISLCMPPLHMQLISVKKLEEFSYQTKKLEENYKKKLANLEELKKSILAKAFAGEL